MLRHRGRAAAALLRGRAAAALLIGSALLGPGRAAEPEARPPERAAEAARPEGGEPKGALAPYRAVRALQALQDRIAHGSAAAQVAQPKMLAEVASAFAAAEPAAWKEPRNAAAAALYLFSAGHPADVRAVLDRGGAFAPEGDRLVKGALAYAEGQDDVARTLLGTIDPKSMPAGLGGHLALVLATLYTEKDPARADAMLDAARLLVPGTLVEEAALRRQIFLSTDPSKLDKFVALSRQYARRYRNSVFAANFEARLTGFAVRLAVEGDAAQLARLDPILAELPRDRRRSVYLTLARDALVAGKPEAARYAAARAGALAPDAAEAERAKLYSAAAGAASTDAPAARTFLLALDGSHLAERDAALRDAAVAVAASVGAGLGDRGQDVAGAMPEAPTTALLDRAARALAAGDALLAAPVGPARADAALTAQPAAPTAGAPVAPAPVAP